MGKETGYRGERIKRQTTNGRPSAVSRTNSNGTNTFNSANTDIYEGMKASQWLPTTKKEAEVRGWDELDVILFSGDAYVDHPSFGVAVIGRTIEAMGLRVGIVPQPDWHGDYRDFKKFGRPRLFFGIAPGCMDSMVNKYTANRRLRSEDAYSPNGRHDCRPEYPTIVYSKILRSLYPDVPIILGGIEASLRRLTHYDYWKDELKRCILCDSGADMIIYGMGEKPVTALCNELIKGRSIGEIHEIPQTVYLCREDNIPGGITDDDIMLHSHSECLHDKRAQAENFGHIEEESNMVHAHRLLQEVDGKYAVVNPPYPPMTTEELDRSYDLPYTRLPHPKYRGKRIPAYEMIRHSVNIHRGCFGGCAFCTISAHQGKFIVSRSKQSILKEVLCVHNLFQGNNIIYNPANEAAKRIADKIMAGRRKVAEIKSQGKNESVLTRWVSILTIGVDSLSLEDCLNLNMYQLFDLMERYSAFVEWDTDLKVRLAGGKPDKTVETWMRDLHPKN